MCSRHHLSPPFPGNPLTLSPSKKYTYQNISNVIIQEWKQLHIHMYVEPRKSPIYIYKMLNCKFNCCFFKKIQYVTVFAFRKIINFLLFISYVSFSHNSTDIFRITKKTSILIHWCIWSLSTD